MRAKNNMKCNMMQNIILSALILAISPLLWAANTAEQEIKSSNNGQYIIKNRDTLWDISGTYLKNPFSWPSIWKENKYIQNPDLIYPGNSLNIPGMLKAEDRAQEDGAKEISSSVPAPSDKDGGELVSKEKGEGRVPIKSKGSEMPLEEERVLPDIAIELQKGDMGSVSKVPMKQMPPEVSRKSDRPLSIDYIIADGIDGGFILGSKDEREILGEMDRVFIKAPNGEIPIVGDSYKVVRMVKKVVHPKTGKPIGNLIRTLGIIKVVDVNGDLVSANIVRSNDYITKGDRIIPQKQTPDVPISKNQEKLKLRGYIVETNYEKEANAQFDIVYIDMGRMEGVEPGDNFLIYSEGNRTRGYSQEGEGILAEIAVGRLKILASQENTSTALVVRSSDTIEKGFMVERVVE